MDLETFIARAVEKWGERFGYERCGEWNGWDARLDFLCRKCEEYFSQTPKLHLKGVGCKKCGRYIFRTNDGFIAEAKKLHGDKYDYSRVEYVNTGTKIWIGCAVHGWFQQRPTCHLRPQGCSDCGKEAQRITADIWLARFREAHGDKYEYPFFEATRSCEDKIEIICPTHGLWNTTTLKHHANGVGCPTCGAGIPTTQEFITRAHLIPGYKERYDYSEIVYVKAVETVTITCIKHKSKFNQVAYHHLRGTEGCPKCQLRGWSKKQIHWLEYVESTTEGGPIQHQLNGGEYHIPGTKYRADGWRPETNTIYEFHGSLWHAHPSHPGYQKNEIHPLINNKTWEQVYQDTLKKEQRIRELGFNLVVMWEHEFKLKT